MSGHSAESDAGRMETLRDECVRDDVTWTIEAHDDQPIADGKKHAADLRVLVLLNGERVREFLYPSYRIWTLLAHWTEGIDALMAELATVTPPADGREVTS